jgi:hypothetical protein
MPRRDVALADKCPYLDELKTSPVNTGHNQLSEMSGVPK